MRLRPVTLAACALAILAPSAAEDPEPALPTDGPIVRLPPVIVEWTNGPKWLYVRTGSAEYLSRCSPTATRDFMAAEQEALRLIKVLIPDRFLVRMDVPEVTLLTTREGKQEASDAVMADAMRTGIPNIQFLPNLRISDMDATALFASLDGNNSEELRLIALPSYVNFLLQRRVPALPGWLIEGLVALYGHAGIGRAAIALPPFEWLSADESRALARDAERPRTLLPMVDLISPDVLRGEGMDSELRTRIWRAESELFCRWALDPANGGQARDAFWNFVARSCDEPATLGLFAECFGFGPAEMRDRLSDYLHTAVSKPVRIDPGNPPQFPPIQPRNATDDEIARLRGEWERMEIAYVKAHHPRFTTQYASRALSTLRGAFDRGDRDPQLLASLGLCEIDAGDDAGALPFLEQAAAAHIVRPRAYFELARLRCGALLRAHSAGRPISADEIDPIAQPLRIALTEAPPLAQAYALLAFVWRKSDASPPAADVEALSTGARLFMQRTP